MKISIDIDCTPDEARGFFGLPDVKPMQEAVMSEMQSRMLAAVKAMDPETMVGTWLPAGLQSLEQMQKMFWNQMTQGAQGKAQNKEGRK